MGLYVNPSMSWRLKTTTICPSLTRGSPAACRFSAQAGWAGVKLTWTRCSVSHAYPPAHLTPLHRNEEMAAPALPIQEAPEMAAALMPSPNRRYRYKPTPEGGLVRHGYHGHAIYVIQPVTQPHRPVFQEEGPSPMDWLESNYAG